MTTVSKGPKAKGSKKSGDGRTSKSSDKAKATAGKIKLKSATEILENILKEKDRDYFSFFQNASELLAAVDEKDRKDFAKSLRAHLQQHNAGEIIKTVHILQDAMLLRIENDEVRIFGGGVSYTDSQLLQFQQLFFCAAADENMQTVFELDLRYFKTVEMTGEVIRSKVLSVEKALYPFLIVIRAACFIDENDMSSSRLEKSLQILESISSVKDSSVDKLDNTVSAYSFLAFALCICVKSFEDGHLSINDPKYGMLRACLSLQSYCLSFNQGRSNVKDFEDFTGYATQAINFGRFRI